MNIINFQINNQYTPMKGKTIDSLKKIGYTAIGGVSAPIVGDIFVKQNVPKEQRKVNALPDKNFEYEFCHLYLLNTDDSKKLYAKCTENIVEPEYVKYNWKTPEGATITREYIFYDKENKKRKVVEIDESGILYSVTLYNEEQKPYYVASISFNSLGKSILTKCILDGSDKRRIIKKEQLFID